MKLVWRTRNQATASIITSATNSSVPSTTASNVNLNEKASAQAPGFVAEAAAAATAALASKETAEPAVVAATEKKSKFLGWGWRLSKKPTVSAADPEKGSTPQARPIRLFAPLHSGLGVGLSICACARLPYYCLCLHCIQSSSAPALTHSFRSGDWIMITRVLPCWSPYPSSHACRW